jgi:hypothetical protein
MRSLNLFFLRDLVLAVSSAWITLLQDDKFVSPHYLGLNSLKNWHLNVDFFSSFLCLVHGSLKLAGQVTLFSDHLPLLYCSPVVPSNFHPQIAIGNNMPGIKQDVSKCSFSELVSWQQWRVQMTFRS